MGARFGQAVESYLQSLLAAGRSRQTLTGSKSALKLLGAFAKADKLQSVAASVPAFLALQHERLSHNSAAILSVRLRLFFTWCVQAHLLKVNPFDVLARTHMAYKIVIPLTDEELRRLLAAGDMWDRAVIILLLSTGLRIGELVGLKWSDIHGDTIRVTGKGGKDRLVALGQTGYRIVSTLPRVNGHVIPLRKVSVQCRLGKLSQRTGIRVHAHLLRHTCADRLRRQGVTVDEIASILGHANLATTMIYLRGNQQERGLAAHRRYNPADALLGGGGDKGNVIPFRPR